MIVGVLAVQGAFAEHEKVLEDLNVDHFQIRNTGDLDRDMDGMIIPGGESTVMSLLLSELDMKDKIVNMIRCGMPVFGTCAGLIMLATDVINDSRTFLGTFPMSVCRNAFGRQLGSFSTVSEMKYIGQVPMEFIRAPVIESVGDGVEILAQFNDKIVAARFGNQLVTAFHPELTESTLVHEYFINMISSRSK